MSGATVASAALSALFNVLLERLASREFVNFFRGGQLSRRLLQNLETTLNTVSAVLDDAEEKQITSPFVKRWLDYLKDVAYDADDFLDEIAYKMEFKQVHQSCSDQVRHLLLSSVNPCRNGVGDHMKARLEDILERLDHLLQQNGRLGLVERSGVGVSSTSSQRMQTTSLVDDSGIYGRDGDKEAIMTSVLSEDANSRHLGVVPITGMGGIGKTTLAQQVYNDNRVKQQFGKYRAWVCVSEESDVHKLTMNIFKQIGLNNFDSSTPNQLQHKLEDESEESDVHKLTRNIHREIRMTNYDSLTPNQLQVTLEEEVRGKKILLVLDDVWNDKPDWWESLLKPLKNSVAQGSKVVVTTREQNVASVMSTVPSHQLQQLNEDDCWSLFAKHAFDGCSPSSYPNLVEIGRRISRRCIGLPLAAKTMGALLRSERDAKGWEKILESNIWDLHNDNIIAALRLSYHYLPPYLKQCFAYCALFPKDYKFRKEYLVLLWMAEGFIIQRPNQNSGMEEVGAEYLEDLASRSFFQKFGGSEDTDCFAMHDLIHDLARSISGEFCFNGEEDVNLGRLTERTRHLYLTRNGGATLADVKVEVLRSLISLEQGADEDALRHVENNISSLRRLRVLDLRGSFGGISNLVASSKHLRLMGLRGFNSLQKLPKNVTTLCKLQTLVVEDCGELTTLSDSISNLKHLSLLRH